MAQTGFTDLVGCRLPLQQAPLGGFGAGPAAAVAEAGGLGMVAAGRSSVVELARALDPLALPLDRVGVNFLVPFLREDAVRLAAERARVVEFFWGEPDRHLVELVHAHGALAGWQTGSVGEARAAAAARCDYVVAQGVEAGGHVRGRVGLLPLLGEVVGSVDVPVVAAGGIGTARAFAGALAAGADAVRVGTRFVAAEETGAHGRYVEALIEAEPEDAVLTERFRGPWPRGSAHRVLRSSLEAAAGLPVSELTSAPPTKWSDSPFHTMPLYAGQGVGAVRRLQPAREIVSELLATG